MAALDGLIDIDAEIERFVAELPIPDSIHPDWVALTDRLSEQKAAIASEKFGLAGGTTGPGLVSSPNPSAEPNALGQRNPQQQERGSGQIILEPESAPPRSNLRWLLVLLAIAGIMLATAAYIFVAHPDMDWLKAIGG